MTDDEVDDAERRFGLRFPPDYTLFLRTVHTTDPERVQYVDGTIHEHVGRPFFDWTGDPDPIAQALAWPLDGLLWSVEMDESVWHPVWGPRPTTAGARERRVRELAATGPPLVPLVGHRYLVGAPLTGGNPVLSIYGADVVVYATTFGEWLLNQVQAMLSPGLTVAITSGSAVSPIPFWQDVIDG